MAASLTLGSSMMISARGVTRNNLPIKVTVLLSIFLHILIFINYSYSAQEGESASSHNFRIRLEAPTQLQSVASLQQRRKKTIKSQPKREEASTQQSVPVEKEQPIEEAESQMEALPEFNRRKGEQVSIRARYIARILQRIEQHKYYPAIARSRGIEDTIAVSFVLNSPSDVQALQIEGKSTLLERVTREVILSALPFDQAPDGVEMPLEVRFSMNFRLQ